MSDSGSELKETDECVCLQFDFTEIINSLLSDVVMINQSSKSEVSVQNNYMPGLGGCVQSVLGYCQ